MKGDWGEGRHICQQFMVEHATLVGFSIRLLPIVLAFFFGIIWLREHFFFTFYPKKHC